jgi:tripartite-type tricarboxylate transporter receptor subunit TctC
MKIPRCWLALVIALMSTASAFAEYPDRSIRMILPFPAGSATDSVARIIFAPLSTALHQSVVIENKPGADGSIAALEVAHARPDGYTLLFATNSPLSAVPAMRKEPPYDPIADFTPITDIGRFRYFMLVEPSLPIYSIKDLIDYSRSHPKTVNFATGNTFGRVATFQFTRHNGFTMTEIPYKGEPPALTDFVAGRIQFMFATQSTSIGFVKAGKLRALATTSHDRLADLPEVPTLHDAGVADVPILPWGALFGPAHMEPEVVARLNREMTAILARPDVKEQLARQAFEPSASTPQALASLVASQLKLWKTTIPQLGIALE